MQYLFYSLILIYFVICLFVRSCFTDSFVHKDVTSEISKSSLNEMNFENLQNIIAKKIREKRSIKNLYDFNLQNKLSKKNFGCRRRSMYININDIGWQNFVVAPINFNAYYCEGSCFLSLNKDTDQTNHAILLSLINLIKPNVYPTSCCVPTELAPLSMIVKTDTNSTSLKIFDDMIVTKCSCR